MPDAVLDRVDHQIQWYDRHATTARIWYCTIKITQIVLAAAVPVAAGLDLPKLLTGSLGGLIVILEGIQQLYRFHDNWVRYRSTASAMERERSLWTARAGDYARADRPDAQLALRIEDLTSRGATQWVALQQAQSKTGPDASPDAGSDAAGGPDADTDADKAAARPGADETTAGPGRAGTPPPSATPVDPGAPVPAHPDETAPTPAART